VAYQLALLNSSAFKYFPNRGIFEFELRGGARHAGARGALISWLESDKTRLFYAQNLDSVELDKSGYLLRSVLAS
jgi:hypothetical protein